tara:strand:+ start:558 stop:833 length:276 start_codon:yes stop_codon:yes gene_type:complete
MRIYQVYRWDQSNGPQVRFFRNKAEATKEAKRVARESASDSDVEVSVIDIPLNKAGVIRALNCVKGQYPSVPNKVIASYEPKGLDDEEWMM